MTVFKPERVADQREPDAGIAGGALDHRAARLKLPRVERVADDEQRGAVLDRLARIHELGLAEDHAAGLFGRALELDQRGVADRLDDAVAVGHLTALWSYAGSMRQTNERDGLPQDS